MSVSSSTAIFMLSLLAIPLTYIVNTAQSLHGEVGLLFSGIASLLLVCFLTHMFVGKEGQATDPLFYGKSQQYMYMVVNLCNLKIY